MPPAANYTPGYRQEWGRGEKELYPQSEFEKRKETKTRQKKWARSGGGRKQAEAKKEVGRLIVRRWDSDSKA